MGRAQLLLGTFAEPCTAGTTGATPLEEALMGTAVSLLMIAAGAIMTWAVTTTASGFSIHTVGIILMVVGAIGLVLSIIFWSSWGGFNRRAPGDTTTTVVEP